MKKIECMQGWIQLPVIMFRLMTRADIISVMNACFGFLAIFAILRDEVRLAFVIIMLSLLADGLDGIVARYFGSGKMGENLEAMADMLSLAIAPLLFVYQFSIIDTFTSADIWYLFLIVSLIYLSFSVIRLASFHVYKDKNFFVGLPASVGTIILVCLVVLEIDSYSILFAMIVIALLLISPIRFSKPSILINTGASVLIFCALLFYSGYHAGFILMLLTGMVFYVIGAPIHSLIVTINKVDKIS